MDLAGASVLLIEQAPQNGCYQCLCLWRECQWLFAFLRGFFKISKWVMTQASFKLLPLCWDSDHVRFYMCP